jgi:ribonuclease HII
LKHQCIVKGDSLSKEISGASILAKVSRDIYIENFIEEHPDYNDKYGLLSNKGYAAKVHIEGIKEHGYTPYHRKSFKLKCLNK